MPTETLSNNIDIDDLIIQSQKEEIPISTKNIQNFKDIMIDSKKEGVLNGEQITDFFNKLENNQLNELNIRIRCQEENSAILRKNVLKYLLMKKSLDNSLKENLESVLGENIKDAISHTADEHVSKNHPFIFHLAITPAIPERFSFLILNPCDTMAEEFINKEKINGFGNILKITLGKELNGCIRHLNLVTNQGKKIYHGVEFTFPKQ